MGLAKMESGVACFTIATLIGMATRMENRDRLILCTLVFCLGLSLSKMVFSNPLGLLFF